MGNAHVKDFLAGKEEAETYLQHFMHPEVLNHSKYLAEKWLALNIAKHKEYENFFDWSNVQATSNLDQVQENINLQEKKESLLVGMFPKKNSPDLTNPSFFDEIQVSFNPHEVSLFKDRQNQKFFVLYQIYYIMQNFRKREQNIVKALKDVSSKDQIPKAAEIGIRSGVHLIIGLLREAAEHNPKLKDDTLNFLLDLFAEVKPLSLWGTNKIDSVLDKSLHTVSDYLEELIQSDRTSPESKCKALKVLFSLGLLRGSLPNLLSVVELLNKLKLDVDVVRELKLLHREKADSSFDFEKRFKAASKAFFTSAVKETKEGGAGAEKSPYTSLTTDGKYLYIHSEIEGLLKVGTGFEYTMFGKVYIHKPEYRLKERGSLVYILGKLYYRSAKIAPAPLLEIDISTLEERNVPILFDNLAPNCLYPEMTNNEIELPHAQNQTEEKEDKRTLQKGSNNNNNNTSTSRLPSSLKRDIRLLRPSQRSPAFTEGRYLYLVSQWTVDVQRRGADSDDEDESEQAETKQARYGVDIYDPLRDFEHIRCVELIDPKPVEGKPGQKPKTSPPLHVKTLDEGSFTTNGSQLLVGIPTGLEGNSEGKRYKYFDLETGELVKSNDNKEPHHEYNVTYDSFNNVIWAVNDTKKTFDTISCFKNNSITAKLTYPQDSEFYTPYENDEIIEIAGEELGLENVEGVKKSQGEELKQEDIQTLLSLGFHVSSKKFHTGMIQLQNSENLETTTKCTELFVLANIARLAESYATLEYSSYSKEDLMSSIRRPYSVQLTDKVFTSLLSFLEEYGRSFFEPKSLELDDDTLYEQCSFLSCLRILKYNLAALENFTETLKNLKMKIVEDDFAPRLKNLVWKILESTPFENKEAEELRLAIYNEALSIISYNLSLMYPDFKEILKLLKTYINKIDDTRNKDIVKSILFWLKNREHIIQLVKHVLDSENNIALIDEIKSLIDTILTWETNSFSHFLRTTNHPNQLHKYSADEFLDSSISFVIELQKELIYQLGHKMQEKHLEMTPHHVLLFKLNESICKTAIVMNSEIQEFILKTQKVVEEEVRKKDRADQEEEEKKNALKKESLFKKKKKDEKEPLWKKIENATKALWQSLCDTYTTKVYFSYILSFQINSLSLLSSHFLIAAKTLKHISTFLISLNNLYNVRQSLEKAVTEKMALNLTEKSESFESDHPYASRQHKQEKIFIAGAKSLKITFDQQCAFKKNSDYIQFFSDDKYTQSLTDRLGGFVDMPKEPLIVQGDTVYYIFHSANNNTNSWGYKFTVVASIESHSQSDWMLDLHRSSCWLAGKCAAQLISGSYLQQALLGDEEQKYNNLLNSKLFSGGMEKCYFGSGKEGVWIELSDTMSEFQAGHLIEYLSSDMTEVEAREEEFLNHIIDGHSTPEIEKLIEFLQKQFAKQFVWSNLGGENAARCVRAAFAVIVKHGGLVGDIKEAIKEIENEEVKKGKLTPNLKNLLKKWQAASRMRTWLVEKKKDIDDSIEKSKQLSERKPAATQPKAAAQNQADNAKRSKVAKKAKKGGVEEKVENAPVVENKEEAPKASEPLQIRDSGEIIEKLIDQIVKKAQFLCQLIPAKHWTTDRTEERDKHLLFRASSSQLDSVNKEEEWKRRLQQWKSVRESKQVFKSLEDETQEIHLSLTTSVLSCLQSPISIKRLRKQVECSYLRAICRTIGVNALTSILVGATSSLFREDLVGWLCSALKGSENKLYHFTDNLQGCGHFLESTVNTAFKRLLVAIVKSMATSDDADEIKSMLEALKWKYHGDDHVFLAEIDLFGLLRGGTEHKLLRSTWGKSMEVGKNGKTDSIMVKKLLNLFETMVILCIGKLNFKKHEAPLSQPSLNKKDQLLPALEKHMSYVDEASIDTLLKQAFSVIFSELQEANKNYKDFPGIDWAAYLRSKKRKELQDEKKKKKKGKKTTGSARAAGLFGGSNEEEEYYEEEYDDYGNPIPRAAPQRERSRSNSGSEDEGVDFELERQLRGADKVEDGQGGELHLNEGEIEDADDHEREKEEEKQPEEPQEEEKTDVQPGDEKGKGKKKTKKGKLKAIIEREERLLKEMEEKLYNPEFLYRLLMLLHKCVTTSSDHIWAAVGNPKYIAILMNLLVYGPPPHQALILKTLTGLLENLPMELFIDSMLEYNQKASSSSKNEGILLLNYFGSMLLKKRKQIFKEALEFNGDYTVTCELIALFRSLANVPGWTSSVREWLNTNLQSKNPLEKQTAVAIIGGDFTGLRYGGRVVLHASDRDNVFESNILLKESEEDRVDEATILGFTEEYKEKKTEEEKKKEETKPEKENNFIYLNIGPSRQRNNPLVLLDTSINKETSNFSSIELTNSTRFNAVGKDTTPFQIETFSLKQNMEILQDLFNWAVDSSDIPSLSSESLYLKASSVKALANYLVNEENVAYLLKEQKPFIQKLMDLSKMQIISSNPTTLEVTEERLHRLLVHACEGGVSLGNPKDITATVKNKELMVLFGKDFSVTKFNIISGYNLDKVKGFFELEPLSLSITAKNASSKAILIDAASLENTDLKDIILNAAIVVTYNYDLQKFAEHYDSLQKSKSPKKEQRNSAISLGDESSDIIQSSPEKQEKSAPILYPKCIVNISERAFTGLIKEHGSQKNKQYKNVFTCKKLIDELVEFGFPKEICEKYFEQNYGVSIDVAIGEIAKLVEQEEEERKGNLQKTTTSTAPTVSQEGPMNPNAPNQPRNANNYDDFEEEKKEFTGFGGGAQSSKGGLFGNHGGDKSQDKKDRKGMGGRKGMNDSDEDDKKVPKEDSEDEELALKKKKAAAMMMGSSNQPLQKKEPKIKPGRSDFSGIQKIGRDDDDEDEEDIIEEEEKEEKIPRKSSTKKTLGKKKEEEEEDVKGEENSSSNDEDVEAEEVAPVVAKAAEFEIEKEDPNPCFKCKSEKDMVNAIEEKNRVYDELIDFEDTNDIGKLIIFKHLNYNILVFYARRAVLNLLEKWPQGVENNFVVDDKSQTEFLELIKRLSIEAIFSSCTFGNNSLLNRIKALFNFVFTTGETNSKGTSTLVDKLYSEHVEKSLQALERIVKSNTEDKDAGGKFNTRLPSEIDIEQPCLDYSLWILQNMLSSTSVNVKTKALNLEVLYTIFGLIPAIKNNKYLLWGVLVFCLKVINAVRENLTTLNLPTKEILTNEKVQSLMNYFFLLKSKEKVEAFSRRTQLLSELIINLNRLQKEVSNLDSTDTAPNVQLDLNKFKVVDNLTDIVELMENYQNSKILLASSWLQVNSNILTKEQKVVESDHFYQKNLHTYKITLENASGMNLKFSEESMTDEGDSIVLSSDPEGRLSVQKIGGDLSNKSISFPAGSCYVHFPVKGGDIFAFGVNDQYQYSSETGGSGMTILEAFSKYNTLFLEAGETHTAIVNTDGELWTSGTGNQTGSSSGSNKTLTKVTTKDRVKTLACGSNFTIFATESNELYGFGNNAEGRCGLSWNAGYSAPQLIDFGTSKLVKQIACGNNHTLVVTEDRNVYGTGGNENGQLGITDEYGNSQHGIQTFRVIADLAKKNVIQAVAGHTFSLLLIQESGKTYLMAAGESAGGKLGLGSSAGAQVKVFTRLSALDGVGVNFIAAKKKHCIALTKKGEAYSWGINEFGQLGHGHLDNVTKPKKIAFFKDKQVLTASALYNSTLFIAKSANEEVPKLYMAGENMTLKGKEKSKEKLKLPIVLDYFNDKNIMKIHTGANHAFVVTKPVDIAATRDTHKAKCELTQESLIKGPLFVDIINGNKTYSLQAVNDPKYQDKLPSILIAVREAFNSLLKDIQWPSLTDEKEYLENVNGQSVVHNKACKACQSTSITGNLYVSLHRNENEPYEYLCENCAFKILEGNVSPSLYYRVSRPLKKDLPTFPRSQFYPQSDTYGYVMTLVPSYNEKGYTYLTEKYQDAFEGFANDMKNLKPEIDEQTVDLLNNIAQKQEKTVFDLGENIVFPKEELSVRTAIEKCTTEFLRKRFLILKQFNQKFKNILPFIDFSARKDTLRLRNIYSKCSVYIFWDVKSELFEKILTGDNKSTPNANNSGLKVKVNRMRASKFIQRGKPDHTGEFSVFGQIFQYFKNVGYGAFKVGKDAQPFAVQFVGEAAIDVGGPYREAISQICTEMQSTALPLLIPSPNQKNDSGQFREKWVLNPSANSIVHFKMYEFLGVIMGTSIRSKNFLNLDLPSFVWKQLVDVPLSRKDLENIDRYLIQCLDDIININKKGIDEAQFGEIIQEKYVTTLSDGREVELLPGGKNMMLNFEKRAEWAELVEKIRLDESKKQAEAIRKGLSLVVPEGLLNLLTWRELETLVCGKPILDVDLLRTNTVYRGCSESDAVVEFFWKALTEYTPEERSMYLRFVWGRSRLPLTSKDFPSPHQIEILRTGNRDPDIMLPVAHTCFFSIELPKYSSYEILRDKLKYAITHCQAIDTDGRAYDIWDDDDNF